MTEATTINIVGVGGGHHRPPVVQGPRAVPPFAEYCWLIGPAGAMVVDRSDRKLINDAPAVLRVEDRLLSVPVSSLVAQLEGPTTVPNFRQISNQQ